MSRKTLLLHACCAPCFSYVYELLKNDHLIVPYYFNPNISPGDEYSKRLDELESFTRKKGLSLIIGQYDTESWKESVRDYRFRGEGSERCRECFRLRLDSTFRTAVEAGAAMAGTVMSISPHKDSAVLNSIGSELRDKYGMEYLESDFKRNGGFEKSVVLSRRYGFYRQNYCGCLYSRNERIRDRALLKKIRSF